MIRNKITMKMTKIMLSERVSENSGDFDSLNFTDCFFVTRRHPEMVSDMSHVSLTYQKFLAGASLEMHKRNF